MLVIGYPIYWALMVSGPTKSGVTSILPVFLFVFFAVFILCREWRSITERSLEYWKWFKALDFNMRLAISFVIILILSILLIVSYEAFLPIHLQQEGDALNYHYSLTRQHLIIGSFAHIPWSAFDLYILPIDFALAPFWFATQLPNKIPQFLFFIGLILVSFRLIRYFKGEITISWLLFTAFLIGSHGHGIQFGTAMLDLVNCYLFMAMMDSFIARAHWLFIVEASFYFWSKPFIPVQTLVIALLLIFLFLIARQLMFMNIYFDFCKKIDDDFISDSKIFLKQCLFGLMLMSLLVAGPFLVKSLYYVGTPLYPFLPGIIGHHQIPAGSVAWESLTKVSDYCLTIMKNGYGHGRSWSDWIKHFWLIAVPSHGVNNEFDYPLGLSYLIALGSFSGTFFRFLKNRKASVLSWFLLVFWVVWFMGSQQSRWLYLPLIIMFLLVSTEISKPSKTLFSVLIIALIFNLTSLARSYRSDIKRFGQTIVREEDKNLIRLSDEYIRSGRSDYVLLEDPEIAYARFPVMVRKENFPNVIAF